MAPLGMIMVLYNLCNTGILPREAITRSHLAYRSQLAPFKSDVHIWRAQLGRYRSPTVDIVELAHKLS